MSNDPGASSDDETLFRAVERAKQEWEGTFDAITEGIAVVDGGGVVRRANRALATMLGRDVRDLAGAACCDLLPHHGDEGCPALSSEPLSRTFEVFDDDYHCFEETSHPRPAAAGAILILKDVTKQTLVLERMKKLHEETRRSNRALSESLEQQRRTQEQLIAAEKIASIADLAAGLAHEINNPLGIVSSNLEHLDRHANRLLALVETLAGLCDPSRTAELTAAQAAAELPFVREDVADVAADARLGADRIRRIVAAIGDFAAGDGRDSGPIGLAPLLMDAVIDARARHRGAQIDEPSLDAASAVARIAAPPRQLHQALSRLIDNAVEATAATATAAGDGTDQASTPVRLEVRSDAPSGRVTIDVIDAGPGVPDDVAQRAAAPFFTTHSTGSHLGLGLTIASAIARRLGGTLSLTGRGDGPGARATLTLPSG